MSLVLAIIAAFAVALATSGSVIAHKREARAAEQILERFKLETAGKVADARTAGIAAGELAATAGQKATEANVAVAKARERTAELEKEAAQLRLDLENERNIQAPRSLTKEQFDVFQALRGKVTALNITSASTPETMLFRSQITNALQSAGIKLLIYQTAMSGTGRRDNISKDAERR